MEAQPVCPACCNGENLTDPAVDAVHQLVLTPVLVVALNRRTAPLRADVVRIIEATDLEVAAYRYVGDEEVWVVVVGAEPSGQRLEVSVESARRLVRSFTQLLDEVART